MPTNDDHEIAVTAADLASLLIFAATDSRLPERMAELISRHTAALTPSQARYLACHLPDGMTATGYALKLYADEHEPCPRGFGVSAHECVQCDDSCPLSHTND